jgi:ferredoxin
MCRELDEIGFRSVMTIERSGSKPEDGEGPNITGRIIRMFPELEGRSVFGNSIVTRKIIKPVRPDFTGLIDGDTGAGKIMLRFDRLPTHNKKASLTNTLETFAMQSGADLFGVSSAQRLNEAVRQIEPAFSGKRRFVAKDKSIPFTPWDPELHDQPVRVLSPGVYLPGAQSVIVFGVRFHREAVRWAAKPPAEAVGPYAFQTYITGRQSALIGMRLIKKLQALGYRAAMSDDLLGTASVTANPRGPQPDLFSNRFAAVAAGLGILSVGGHTVSPEFGLNQRFTAVITDAVLDESPLLDPGSDFNLCTGCEKPCIASCPVHAFTGQEFSLSLNGCIYTMQLTDPVRCDWSKRYALVKESGFGYLGSPLDAYPEEEITVDDLSQALKRHDPVKKYRPVVAEPCVLACPYTGR